MRRLPTLVAALAVLLAGCASPAPGPTAPPQPPPPPLRVLLAGDSLVDGYYATSPDLGFVPLVVEALGVDHDVTPVVVGVSGARAFRVAAAVEEQTVGAEPVDVAVLEVGGNDVGKSTLREWVDGFQRLIAAVRATSPDAALVCLGPWNEPGPSRRYEVVVQRLCADESYLSLGDFFADARLHGPGGRTTTYGPADAFHPNDQGHAAIAGAVIDAIGEASRGPAPGMS